MLDGSDGYAVAKVDGGAKGRSRNAREMHGDRADDRAVIELALDTVTAVDGRRFDGQSDRQRRVHAKATKFERTTNGALARRQVLHKVCTPTLTRSTLNQKETGAEARRKSVQPSN